jgi:hypothetical protein
MKDRLGRALLILTMISLATGVTACRKDEQGRPMTKQKGVYEGPADEKLAEDQLEDLRLRATGQKF